jgi:hypothetical protein
VHAVAAGCVVFVLLCGLSAGCKRYATPSDCDAVVKHFAELSAKESGLDPTSPEVAKVVAQAKDDPDALACSTELERRHVECALAAGTSESVIACLEAH